MKITIDGQTYEVEVQGNDIKVNGKSFAVQSQRVGNLAVVTIDGKATVVELKGDSVVLDGKEYKVSADGLPRVQVAPAPVAAPAPRPAAPRPSARPQAQRPAAAPAAQRPQAPAARPAAPAAPRQAPAPAAAQPAKPAAAAGGTPIKAPMPGKILRVPVKVGDKVPYGGVVAVLEAMKMENEIRATVAGVVTAVNVADGSTVNAGDTLVMIEG